MISVALALALAFQDTSRAPVPPGAYPDSSTASLVASARAARQRNERLVTSYTAEVTERLGVGIHALSRDRMLFHQELAAHIEWYRDRPSRIEMKGARQAVPIALRGVQVPEDLNDEARSLVMDPAEDYLRVVGADSDGFSYPLRVGGENDYRFRAGDTTTITLPTGRSVRLLELVVTPRRADFRLMSGSLWFDADTYGLVRAVFRPARPFDLRRDADSSDRNDIPSWLNVGAEVKYVTLEYGLYEFRWWLPRYMAIDAVGTVGSFMNVPFRFERTYTDYHVQGGTPPPVGSTFRPAGSVRRGRGALARARDSVRQRTDSLTAAGVSAELVAADSVVARLVADTARLRERFDSTRQARRECLRKERDSLRAEERRRDNRPGVEVHVSARGRRSACFPPDTTLVVVVPEDTMALVTSPDLGPPILDMGDVLNQGELEQLGREIGALGQRPWEFHPQLPHRLTDALGHVRYNRVEALSLGLSASLDFSRLTADGGARIGVADWEPNFEAGLTRPTENARFRLGAYRRLAAANPELAPLDIGNSLSAFFLGRDDGVYYRTLGVELTGAATTGWYRARLFAERQRGASVNTEVSLPHLFSAADTFQTNIAAQLADQAGASLTIRGSRAVSGSLTVGAEASGEGAIGTFRYARGSLTLRSTVAPPGPLVFGFEAAAGSSTGTVPIQSAFFLGGPPTLRGFGGGAFAGDAFWRGRVDVGNQFPAARLMLFADAGWAGQRSAFQYGKARWGGGIGASFLDGLIRLDLARAFSTPRGWRFDMYVDGIL